MATLPERKAEVNKVVSDILKDRGVNPDHVISDWMIESTGMRGATLKAKVYVTLTEEEIIRVFRAQ